MMPPESSIYGLLAEFEHPQDLLAATRRAHEAGFRRMDAYAPFPVHGLSDALGFRSSRLPIIVLIGGVIGCLGGFLLQYYTAVHDYPINVGGRPLNSWPAFVPITFECTILAAGLSAVFGMLALNGLPQPYHPLFNVPSFELASRSHFFLCIESRDAKFDAQATRQFLAEFNPRAITLVPGGYVQSVIAVDPLRPSDPVNPKDKPA